MILLEYFFDFIFFIMIFKSSIENDLIVFNSQYNFCYNLIFNIYNRNY